MAIKLSPQDCATVEECLAKLPHLVEDIRALERIGVDVSRLQEAYAEVEGTVQAIRRELMEGA